MQIGTPQDSDVQSSILSVGANNMVAAVQTQLQVVNEDKSASNSSDESGEMEMGGGDSISEVNSIIE